MQNLGRLQFRLLLLWRVPGDQLREQRFKFSER